MKDKIVNLLERHVEKVVLAVAVAGAGFIAWSGMAPTTLPDDTSVTASNVETKVSEAVDTLERARKSTQAKSAQELTPTLQNYVGEYNRIMLHHPLPEALVSPLNVPQFAPLQEAIYGVNDNGGGGQNDTRIVAPTVPEPKNVTVVADRGSVLPPPLDPTQAAAAAAPGAVPPQPLDKNWVCVSGNIPWKDYLDSLNDPKLKAEQKLAPGDQRAVLYRIDVERRTRTGNSWTTWEKVAPSKAGGDPVPDISWADLSDTDWSATVSSLDASFQRLAEPSFYYLAPKDPTQPPTPIIAPIAKAPPTTAPAAVTSVTTPVRPGTPTVPPRGTLPPGVRGEDAEGNLIFGPGAAPAAPAQPGAPVPPVPGLALDVNALKAQGTVPFWFWDETVEAGKDYQYRVRLQMYNPVYRYPGGLADPKMKDVPVLSSAWVNLPTTVSVSGDLYFFVNSNMNGASTASQKVDFLVFKWTNGGWYQDQWSIETGTPLNGSISIIDKNPLRVDVSTGYTLVDIQTTANGDLIAILLSPTGDLVTHSATADSSQKNAERKDKEKLHVRLTPKPPAPKPVVVPINRPPGRPNVPNPEENNNQ